MLIESNICEILLNIFPVYSIAPDKRIFLAPVFFTMGCDSHMCICLLWHFILTKEEFLEFLQMKCLFSPYK